MKNDLIIKNARLVDPATDKDQQGAVWIKNGKIKDVHWGNAPEAPEGTQTYDAEGHVIAPGLIDTRVSTGEPGHEYRETLESASNAAAAGGVTSFLLMPDTTPVIDDGALVDYVVRRASATSKVKIWPSAAISKGLEGKDLTEFGLLKAAGARAFTDGNSSIQSTSMLKNAFTYAKNFDMPILHHVGDSELIGDGVMNAGILATGLGLKGIPHEAETIPLARDLQLADMTGVRYHAAQISCAKSAELVQQAKQRNDQVSAGLSINNLCLNENDIGSYRSYFKLNPPLRSEDERMAMVEALRDGTIDILHSAHDPQDTEGKRRPFAEATDGAIGLETFLAASLRLVHEEQISLVRLLATMTINPAKLLGLEAGRLAKGAPADLIEIDLNYPWVVAEKDLKSKSQNTTFEHARLFGKVMTTWVNGDTVFRQSA
ncbi:dihydroorotase [Maritalea mediterranea]|uniref:Dihydroorotase n=1 Tax=Maritalea mediterranea TaxID=2909667 RepID=A0ABS9EEK1_9HYPH|nr:dihydroorotase [Maritalea mediterranea]MCF4099886.1 dihydroorotase [Maritalea mediterranea]